MTKSSQRRLLVTSGDGPQECRRAVSHIVRKLEREALTAGLRCLVEKADAGKPGDPASAIVVLGGLEADRLAISWTGTIKWICKSPFRPHHKRQNWFVGVYKIDEEISTTFDLSPLNFKIETFRAGGPGGQHQNTTDSGVRITHIPSGISAISTGERSQHRNRQLARERLVSKILLLSEAQLSQEKSAQNRKHKLLQRGNPIRVFKGEKFQEKKL